MSPAAYRTLADGVLILHVAYIGFVIIGLLLILIGGACGWNSIRNPWFRFLHLLSITLVVVQAWLGIICPLTTLEMHLRGQAGDWVYHETFIAHWLQRLIFYRAPMWVFGLAYTLFGLAVIGSWWRFPPGSRQAGKRPPGVHQGKHGTDRQARQAAAPHAVCLSSYRSGPHIGALGIAVSDSEYPQVKRSWQNDPES